MMDLMILVAVFVAILALAYFTYRNIVGLDSRIRKIEDVLRNAEVVASPHSAQSAPIPQPQDTPQVPQGIPGWGGEGPPEMSVNVERVEADVAEDEEYAGDDEGSDLSDEDEDDDDEGDADDGEADDGEADDDEADDGEADEGEGHAGDQKATRTTVRVSDLREALKKAGVSFPNGAKKALLMSLAQENNVELSA
jgi:hypothetical protein